MMKKVLSVFYVLFLAVSAYSQVSFSAKTGDSEFDATLSDMNVRAKADLKLFKKDLSVSFGVNEGKLDNLMVSYNMQPADLYMALQLAKETTKPVEQVAESFKSNKDKGWGVIAKELGIKPGSKEFHELKNNAKGKNDKMKENKGKGKAKGGNGNAGGNNKGKGKKK